jgi:Secretion system C-terminal sorting domain
MRISILLCIVFFSHLIYAQQGPTVYLETQAQVNDFPQLWGHDDHFRGTIFIGSYDTSSLSTITDLTPLSFLKHVWFLSIIRNGNLQSLAGLSNIDSIGDLRIKQNKRLKNLQGFDKLRTCYYNGLGITANDSLQSLLGLDSLVFAEGIFISDNLQLGSLAGLSNLKKTVDLVVANNDALTTLSGMTSLQVAYFVTVTDNDKLLHFGDFPAIQPALQGVYPSLNMRVYDNASLVDFSELHLNASAACGEIEIFRNPALTSLKGLDQIRDASVIKIHDNPQLRQVGFDSLYQASRIIISGSAIDSIKPFASLRTASLFVQDCKKLKYLHNVLPNADSCAYTIFDNFELVSIHEDAGPRKVYFNVDNSVHDTLPVPKLRYITGFDSLLQIWPADLTSQIFWINKPTPGDSLILLSGFNNLVEGHIQVNMMKSSSIRDTLNYLGEISGFKSLKTLNGPLQIQTIYPASPHRVLGFDSLESQPSSLQFLNLIEFHLVQDTFSAFYRLKNASLSISRKVGCRVDPRSFGQLENSNLIWPNGRSGLIDSIGNELFPWGLPFALPKLATINLWLETITGSDSLLNPYPSLQEVGLLSIQAPYLKTLTGFHNLQRINGYRNSFFDPWQTNIYITDCDSLTDCSGICNILQAQIVHPQGGIIIDNAKAPCSNLATVTAYCDTLTSSTKPEPMMTLGVFPNPVYAGARLNLNLDGQIGAAGHLSIFDAQGAKVFDGKTATQDGLGTITLPNWLPSGVYFVVLQSEFGNKYRSKVIVMH